MSLPTYRVRRSEPANKELADIFDYIADRASVAVADRYVSKLLKACRSLQTAPHRGTLREEWGAGIHAFGVAGSATIVFTVDDKAREVNIIAILYGGRDVAAAIKDR